jgi:PKHD-type hydroxylase
MFVRILKLLNGENLQLVDELVTGGTFTDGAATTGNPTKSAKKNLQLELATHPRRDDFLRMVSQTLNANPVIRSVALPKRMTMPLVSKYETGMAYGWHIDNPLMYSMGNTVRTDVAGTIFVSDKNSYDGGELVVRSAFGDARVKLDRGDCFLYPATSRHQVLPVTRGERVAIVFWIQSIVADPAKRELLYDLELAYDVMLKENPQSEALQMLQRAQTNLVRRWSEV